MVKAPFFLTAVLLYVILVNQLLLTGQGDNSHAVTGLCGGAFE
jgi:hypothetical protein